MEHKHKMGHNRVGIIGSTGYTGLELVRIISRHKHFELTVLTSESYAGKQFSEVYPQMAHICDITLEENNIEAIKDKADIFFLCLPHGTSMAFAKELYYAGKVVIDLSADFRVKDYNIYEKAYKVEHSAKDILHEAVYGHAEIFKDEIAKSRLIAVPGCYPTSIITPLYPLLKNSLIEKGSIIADSKSGVSGAGRKPTLTNAFCEANEDFKPYGIFSHRHNSEIDYILDNHVTFTPHLLPINRGILSTIYLKSHNDFTILKDCLKSFYRKSKIVRILDTIPCIKYVANSPFIDINIYGDEGGNIIIVSAIDNLLKGASSQAVQCANIVCGYDDFEGLI